MVEFLLKTNLLGPALFLVGGFIVSLFLVIKLKQNKGKINEK